MNIESLRIKLTKDFSDYYGEEGLALVNDYCENDNEVLYFIVSDKIKHSCSYADTILLDMLRSKLNINNVDTKLHEAICGRLVEISNKKISSNFKPFDFIKRCNPDQVLNVLRQEAPQTIAFVLFFLEANKAAVILQKFPAEIQCDLVRRISAINAVEPETIKEIEKILEKKLSVTATKETIILSSGVETIAEILNLVERPTEKKIIERLKDEDPELTEKIKKRMFAFEDIIKLHDRAIQKVIRETDSQDLTMALKNVDTEVQGKVFRNMSKRASSMIMEDMEYMGPVRLSDVEKAQQKIVLICRHLEAAGEIVITKPGEDVLVGEGVPDERKLYDKQGLPYYSMFYLLVGSKKEIVESLDNNILAVSFFGAEKYQKEMFFKRISFTKKLKLKKMIKELKEIWYDDVLDAQTTITEILKEKFDPNDVDNEFKAEICVG